MAEFERWDQYWHFAQFVMREARHFLDTRNKQFVDAVIETSAKRKAEIEKGSILWRAQLGHEVRVQPIRDAADQEVDSFELESPFPPERMRPLPYRANEGSVNPKGIPCLYFSNDRDTAMTETRPWIGSNVSAAQFVIMKSLSLVDCSADSSQFIWISMNDSQRPLKKREGYVRASINQAFSEPVTRNDDVAEYAPTQVLAEAFRIAGYEGIIYGSKLGSGKNHCHL